MANRWQLIVVAMCFILAASSVHAAIYRWDNGQVIPGTEGIEPGPRVQLDDKDLQWADLRGEDLTGASFEASNLTNADLTGTKLANADLTGAVIAGVSLSGTTSGGFTKEMLYSTASYQDRNLRRVDLLGNDLTGWDFSGQDLTDVMFGFAPEGFCDGSNLTEVNLTGAIVTGTSFSAATGLTPQQLYSTASYKNRNLQRVELACNNLAGWNLGGQDLTHSDLSMTTLNDSNLSEANLSGAIFSNSTLTNASLTGTLVRGAGFWGDASRSLTREQLYATESFQRKDLQGIVLGNYDLTGSDLSGQNLSNANLSSSTLTNANLSGADLTNARLAFAEGLPTVTFDATTAYNQWTAFPKDFDPVRAGLTFLPSSEGDFDSDNVLGVSDIDLLTTRIVETVAPFPALPYPLSWLPEAMFDLNGDESINHEDYRVWLKDLKNTWYGDANLDGEFNSGDMVQVFAAGKYESGWVHWSGYRIYGNASWAEGDWNGDLFFDSSDMVTAFADGGYEKGPRVDAVAVPEPCGLLLFSLAVASLLHRRGHQ